MSPWAAVVGAERFLAEIRTTANLQHTHILPLHDTRGSGTPPREASGSARPNLEDAEGNLGRVVWVAVNWFEELRARLGGEG